MASSLVQVLVFLLETAKRSSSKLTAFQYRAVEDGSASYSLRNIPDQQTALILYGAKKSYVQVDNHPVPATNGNRELLVRNLFVGLNPIDWKAPDYNFGIPTLPYVSGRELLGEVVTSIPGRSSRLKPGDKVLVVSTNYRDLRKATYQQFVVTTDFNAARLPSHIPPQAGAAVGVAFVAAALSLGICAGLDFSSVAGGPDLLSLVRGLDPGRLPDDVRAECLEGIGESSRAKQGDWVAIWGGSSTSAFMMVQLARLAGLRTTTVLDCKKHASGLASDPNTTTTRPDMAVDSHDPSRAIDVIRATTDGKLRFAIDTVGSTTAAHLLDCLAIDSDSGAELQSDHHADPQSISSSTNTIPTTTQPTHLIGLTGLPKESSSSPQNTHTRSRWTKLHRVPIKLFHEIPELGEALMVWLEKLLEQRLLVPPRILAVEEGFGAVNGALDRMRRGEISGGKVVVKVG